MSGARQSLVHLLCKETKPLYLRQELQSSHFTLKQRFWLSVSARSIKMLPSEHSNSKAPKKFDLSEGTPI